VQINTYDTAQDIVNRCKYLFNLEDNLNNNFNSDSLKENQNNNNYQLWLKTGDNEPLIPLIGKFFTIIIIIV